MCIDSSFASVALCFLYKRSPLQCTSESVTPWRGESAALSRDCVWWWCTALRTIFGHFSACMQYVGHIWYGPWLALWQTTDGLFISLLSSCLSVMLSNSTPCSGCTAVETPLFLCSHSIAWARKWESCSSTSTLLFASASHPEREEAASKQVVPLL